MIFHFSKECATAMSAPERAQLYSDIINNGHYVDCDEDIREMFYHDIRKNGSKIQKEMMAKDPSLKLNRRVREYLRFLNAEDFTGSQLKLMINKPARLLVENKVNEGPVYRDMIGTYASADRTFGNQFKKLHQALKDGWLEFEHGGGCDAYVRHLEYLDKEEYKEVARYKIGCLIDRDTDDEKTYYHKRNPFFRLMCGKDHLSVTEKDIYTLNQPNYIWHMWYRRAIENYFPDKQFLALGVDLATMPPIPSDRNYKKMGGLNGYNKHDLPKLTNKMNYADYEYGLKHFNEGNRDFSELQLFLLKLLKLV